MNRIHSDDTGGAHAQNARDELYRVLFEHSPDAIWLIDPYTPEGTWPIVDCNEAACRMHGYTREELLGQSIDMFDPAPSLGDKYREHVDALWRERHVEATDVHRRKDGSLIHIEYSTTLVTLDGRNLMLGVDRDVTARTLAEREVLQAKVQAEHASRAKSEFLSRMSHELRTPLTTILGYGQLLHNEVLDSHHQAYAGHIIDAGDHLLNMVDDVLDMSRAEASSLSLELQSVRLGPVISAAIELVRLEIAVQALRLDTAAIDNDVAVIADPHRLTQVLVNLLDNAAKYNRRGGMITMQCQLTPRFVRVVVQDTGRGIPDDQLRRLFIPFERLGAEQRGIDGVGLGLAFSKHLIEMMHGSIGVQSRVGAGSTFWFQLPRAAS